MTRAVNGLVSTAAIRSIWRLLKRFKEKSSSLVSDPVGVFGRAGLSPDVFMPACERLRSLGYIRYGSHTAPGRGTILCIFVLKDFLGPDISQDWEAQRDFPGQGNGIRRNTDWSGGFPLEEDEEEGADPPEDIVDHTVRREDKVPAETKPRARRVGRPPQRQNEAWKILRENARLTASGEQRVDNPIALLIKNGIRERSVLPILAKLEKRKAIRKVRDPKSRRKIGSVVLLPPSPNA